MTFARKPMVRTGFKRKILAARPPVEIEAACGLQPGEAPFAHQVLATPARRGTYASPVTGIPVSAPKTEIVRSEAYRRLVAAMPCIACGCGPCQAAHPNTDKGMAMKTDDRLCFPLCGPQPGRPGCHALFDQGAMFSKAARRAIEPAWGADTRRRILANGQWPQRLPLLNITPKGKETTE